MLRYEIHSCEQMMELITEGTRRMVGGGFIINTNHEELVDSMIEGIEKKRAALGI